MKYLEEWRELFSFWRNDLISGITVGIVALPLALGFAITTGAPPSAGLATAIIAGFIAALLGGSRLQVSGPTGAMTVILIPVIQKYGVSAIPALGVIAGVMVILMGLFKLGTIINKVPHYVIEGFTLGIAVIIALQQLPMALGIAKGEGDRALIIAFNTIKSGSYNYASIVIVAITLIFKRSEEHTSELQSH